MNQIIGVPVFKVNRFSGTFARDNIGMSIGTRLKQARKSAKLTQIELGVRTGMSQSAISDLELGNSSGSTNVALLAYHLGVNALWLETGKGSASQVAPMAVREPARPARMVPVFEHEEEMLELIRRLDNRGQAEALIFLRRRADDSLGDATGNQSQ